MNKFIRQGAVAELNVRNILYILDVFHFRIFDTRTLRFLDQKAKIFAQKVPADFFVLAKGMPYLIEVKSTRNERFYLKNIKPHQLSAGERFVKEGGQFLYVIKRINRPRNLWAIFTYAQIKKLLDSNQKSVLINLNFSNVSISLLQLFRKAFRINNSARST